MCLGFIVGYFIIAYILAPVFYKIGVISIYQYLEKRFGISTPIGHQMLNGFYWMVEQIVYRQFEGVAGYGENERKTRCQQENERGQEVIFSP